MDSIENTSEVSRYPAGALALDCYEIEVEMVDRLVVTMVNLPDAPENAADPFVEIVERHLQAAAEEIRQLPQVLDLHGSGSAESRLHPTVTVMREEARDVRPDANWIELDDNDARRLSELHSSGMPEALAYAVGAAFLERLAAQQLDQD